MSLVGSTYDPKGINSSLENETQAIKVTASKIMQAYIKVENLRCEHYPHFAFFHSSPCELSPNPQAPCIAVIKGRSSHAAAMEIVRASGRVQWLRRNAAKGKNGQTDGYLWNPGIANRLHDRPLTSDMTGKSILVQHEGQQAPC